MTDRRKDNLIRLRETIRRTGLSRGTIYRKMADGSFPKTVKIGDNSVAHYESDIDEWIATRRASAL